MTKRRGKYSHYELMFEKFLREQSYLYIAINEAKRPIFRGKRVKNFDFIVLSKKGRIILIDIKGKQFPYRPSNYWENWISRDDAKYLRMWSDKLDACGIIVLPYWVRYKEDQHCFKNIYKFRGKNYGIVAIEINNYHKNSKKRSSAGTGTFNAIAVPREKLRKLLKPIGYFLRQ